MEFTLNQINKIIGGKLQGDANLVITGVSSIENSKDGDITFIKDENYIKKALHTKASAIVAHKTIEQINKSLIIVDNPFLSFIKLLRVISDQKQTQTQTIHPSAIIAKSASVGKDISIGAHVIINENTKIGDNVTLYPNVFVGKDCEIGDNSTIYPNVTIREEVTIGKRALVHSGTTIGGDGFGYLQVEGKHEKIPQVGTVEIGDDVEIGSNVTIARATLDKTIIKSGVKIDNHSHVAHNVYIGEDTMLIAFAKLSGGIKVGKNVMIAGDVSIVDNLEIGDNSTIGAGSGVMHDVEAGSVVWGRPAKPINIEKRLQVLLRKLPDIYKKMKGF